MKLGYFMSSENENMHSEKFDILSLFVYFEVIVIIFSLK